MQQLSAKLVVIGCAFVIYILTRLGLDFAHKGIHLPC